MAVNQSYAQMLREYGSQKNATGLSAPGLITPSVAAPSLEVQAPTTGVSAPSVGDRWANLRKLNEEVSAGTAALNAQGQKASGYKGGGWGPSAYGVTGRTGLANQKGAAPYGLQSVFWNALQRANADMKAAGLGSFGITDGWRSYAAQVAVKKKKGKLAATPGRSVHGLGYAADLRLSRAQQKWLERNGAKYGLARLPSESWHWQYQPKKG